MKQPKWMTAKFEDLGLKSKRLCVINEAYHSCEVCNNSMWMGKPIALEIDHVDGDSDNDSRNNLRAICLNCHAQTTNFRGKNKGKRGSKRRKALMGRHYQKLRDTVL
jgi:hypothetical protein